MLNKQEEDVIVVVVRQYVLKVVVCIYTASINNVRGEEDL